MARKYEVAVGGDTSGFEKAVQNGIVEPLGDAEKAFDKLDKTAKDTELDRELDKAQDATKDLDKELDVTRRSLDKLGYAGRDAGDVTSKGMDRAKDGVKEVGREAESTAKESAASFDGSAESVADAFQEVAANAFAGFGPAGAVAGIAAAAGIGLAVAGFESLAGAQEASEESIAEWADSFIEAGGRVLTASQIAASAQEIVTDPEKWKAAQKNAELWGVSVETAVLAATGHAPSLDAVNQSLEGQRDAFTEATQAGKLNMEQRDEELGRLGEATSAYNTLTNGITQGRAAASVYSQALLDLIATTEGAAVQTDELGNRVYSLPGGKEIFIDAKTGQASENVDRFKGDLETVPKNPVVKFDADTSAFDNAVARVRATKIRVDGQVVYRTADGRQLL